MNERNKPTVVIDTNLLISAIIIKGNSTPTLLLNAWRNHLYSLVTSEELLTEIKEVLKREKIYNKYHISQEEIEEFINNLYVSAIFSIPIKITTLPIHSRDKKDDHLITCALGGNCQYLITGDNDLLVLNGNKALPQLKIIQASDFLQEIL